MQINKKASSEWTVSKLVSLILLIFVIVLVVWGFMTGGFNPLKDKVVYLYDNVLAYFGWDDSSHSSNEVEIPGVGKGKFTMTKEECKVDLEGGKGSYRLYFKEDPPVFGVYTKVYTVTFLGLVNIERYFRYNQVIARWEWTPVSSGNWFSCDNPSVPAPGGGVIAAAGLEAKESYLKYLKDYNLERGEEFFKGKIKTSSSDGNKINPSLMWTKIGSGDVLALKEIEKLESYVSVRDNLFLFVNGLDVGLGQIHPEGVGGECDKPVFFDKKGLYIRCKDSKDSQYTYYLYDGNSLYETSISYDVSGGRTLTNIKNSGDDTLNVLFDGYVRNLKFHGKPVFLKRRLASGGYVGNVLFGYSDGDTIYAVDAEKNFYTRYKGNDWQMFSYDYLSKTLNIQKRTRLVKDWLTEKCR